MRFTCTAGALRDAVSHARAATSTSAGLVAHSGVLLQVTDTGVQVAGTDGETTVVASCPADVQQPGRVLLPPRPLAAYLATVDPVRRITVWRDPGQDVRVGAEGNSPYRFRPMEATFPLPARPDADPVAVDWTQMPAALQLVRPAVSRDLGVSLLGSGTALQVRATDSYRVHAATIPGAGFGDFQGSVPVSVLDRAARAGITHVIVDPRGRTLRLLGDGVEVATRLISSVFPAVDDLLAQSRHTPHRVAFDVDELRACIAPLRAVGEDKPFVVSIDGDTATLAVDNVDLGGGAETVHLEEEATASVRFGINSGFLAEATAHLRGRADVGYSGPQQALYLSAQDPVRFTAVIMPVRLTP